MASNRLDLEKMVHNQIPGHREHVFFDTQFVGKHELVDEERVEPKSFFPKTDISTSWRSILSNVHSQLEARRPTTIQAPLNSIVELDDDPSEAASVEVVEIPSPRLAAMSLGNKSKNAEAASPSGKCEAGPKRTASQKRAAAPKLAVSASSSHPKKSMFRNKSVPQMKARVQQKRVQSTRRARPTEMTSMTHQKRIMEVMHQKHVLQGMLATHERLERDRRTIAAEIQAMRSHVNEIHAKLDRSLKKLQLNPTLTKGNATHKALNMLRRQRAVPLAHNYLGKPHLR